MSSVPTFIYQNINNNQSNAIKGMPLKDSTSDNTSNFELGRKIYGRTYIPPSNSNMVSTPYMGMAGFLNTGRIRPTVFDGSESPNQKKWGSTNRDASQIISNRKNTAVGKGSFNLPSTGQSSGTILVGSSTYTVIGDRNIYWSNDGITWNPVELNLASFDTIWTGSQFISTGGDIGSGVIATSPDGKNWTLNGSSGGYFEGGVAVGVNQNNIVVMGENNFSNGNPINHSLIYSTDNGDTWNPVQDSSGVFTNEYSFIGLKIKGGVLWNGNVWVGAGSGPNSLGYSEQADGSFWQAGISTVSDSRDTAASLFEIGTALANNGSFCVATGFTRGNNGPNLSESAIIAWSNDGISWSPATLYYENSPIPGYIPFIATDVAYNGSLWVAVSCYLGAGLLAYFLTSTDGMNWYLVNQYNDYFPLSLVWDGNMWITTGLSNDGGPSTLYSMDGINWAPNQNSTSNSFLKMAWNGIGSSSIPTLSFTNGNDRNLLRRTLNRVRGGGTVAPAKKGASPSNTYVPSLGTHPYLQPGYMVKNKGNFPFLRYNVKK